jgi:hypothetical protein
MARHGLGQLLGIATLAVVAGVAADEGLFGGPAANWARGHLSLPKFGAKMASAASASQPASCNGWTQVGAADAGGFPLEVQGSSIRQSQCVSPPGTNSYSNNDVFQVLGSDGNPTGQWVAFVGGCHFVDANNHDLPISVDGCS